MNERFVTEALRDDRCLKAHRLLERFEAEITAELERLGRDIVDANPDLFPTDVGSNVKISLDNSTIIANARDNLRLRRVNVEEPARNQKLNISVRWVDPIEWGERDVDGALCAACYKINNGNREDFERVKRDTLEGEWDVSFGEDQFDNAPGILYVPVESAAELQAANEVIREHFTEFGEYWGVEPSDVGTDGTAG